MMVYTEAPAYKYHCLLVQRRTLTITDTASKQTPANYIQPIIALAIIPHSQTASSSSTMLSNLVPNDPDAFTQSLNVYRTIQHAFAQVPWTSSLSVALSHSSPSPFLVDIHTYRQLSEAHDAIVTGIRAVVAQWADSERLRRLLPVHPRIERILRKAPRTYHMGTVRPDVLYAEDGSFKVCEINARFPLNGYMIASLANNALQNHSMDASSFLAQHGLSAVSSLLSFMPDLKKRLTADGIGTVWILNGREPEHDLAVVGAALGINTRHCSPELLVCEQDSSHKLYCREADGNMTQIRSCIIELHQDELLSLHDDVLEALALLSYEGHALNDFRTIFLAHDKRMLCLLLSEQCEIDAYTRQLLKKYVAPTTFIDNASVCRGELKGKSLVLKPCLYGKGEGIEMQKNMSDEQFVALTKARIHEAPHVFQEYVKQRTFELLTPDGRKTNWKTVGIISSLDGKFYGPGIFRSNEGDRISITGGGIASYPVMKVHGIPAQSRSMCSALQFADCGAIVRSLSRDGVALIGVEKNLGDKQELAQFLTEGLGAKCRTHSDVEGEVWDIKPVVKWTAQHARSHTTRAFEIHTDASFEKKPPRFVAMSVIHADRRGGGLFSVSNISEAVSKLTQQQIDDLMSIKVRWIVPGEFRKSGEGDTFAPVLLSRDKARFRQDKVTSDHLGEDEASRFKESFKAFCGAVEEGMSDGYLVPEQTVIIIDNQKFAHCRSEVMDMERHLHRVRFDLPDLREEGAVF
eukprot:TRINITY_DN47951_c0_g1_i1.p1 TRINITY_DN47951_c0_g1~~TRINITY_DN47951_c0_g1_i1.p1  ORF type:complete len:747 (-),score=121.25 TRINITY_DN47951_c0_g1_i1:57-2297(-)